MGRIKKKTVRKSTQMRKWTPGEEEDDGENPEDVALDEDSMPEWIASLKGVHFFTLTQALVSPSAMHLRNLNAVYGAQGVRGARGKMLTMA